MIVTPERESKAVETWEILNCVIKGFGFWYKNCIPQKADTRDTLKESAVGAGVRDPGVLSPLLVKSQQKYLLTEIE